MRNMEHVMTVKYLGESVPLQQTVFSWQRKYSQISLKTCSIRDVGEVAVVAVNMWLFKFKLVKVK